jgi:hypothetical protein
MRPERERRLYFCGVETGRMGAYKHTGETEWLRLGEMNLGRRRRQAVGLPMSPCPRRNWAIVPNPSQKIFKGQG